MIDEVFDILQRVGAMQAIAIIMSAVVAIFIFSYFMNHR
jgi:hypothetical protein